MQNELIETELRALFEPLASKADFKWTVSLNAVSSVAVEPLSSGACGFSVIWSSHETIIGFGERARVELDPGQDGLDDLTSIVTALIQGRVRKVVRRYSERVTLDIVNKQGDRREWVIDGGWRVFSRHGATEIICTPY